VREIWQDAGGFRAIFKIVVRSKESCKKAPHYKVKPEYQSRDSLK
jgi:hypothetical protein